MTYEEILVERRGPVGWLVFDRPAKAHAMNHRMMEELERAWRELDADPAVRVIVNTGSGAHFQTGLDVAELSRDKEALREQLRRTRDAELAFTAWHLGVDKPVIAAVNGTCAGGGLHFVADADIVIAASTATFLDPHVSVGQVTAYERSGSSARCRSRRSCAWRWSAATSGCRRRARTSWACSRRSSTRRSGCAIAAQELAETIARNSPAAMRATKRALWGALELGLTDACRAGAQELVRMWGHPDQEEGPSAFAEKREPQWLPLVDDTEGTERER